MSEPFIPNPFPLEIPSKTYNQQYITRTTISAMPARNWDVNIESKPYDGVNDVLNQTFAIKIVDIKACAALVPQVAEAMQKMIEALGVIAVAARATNTKVITPQNITQVLAAIAPQE
jgi:hypothetical protein